MELHVVLEVFAAPRGEGCEALADGAGGEELPEVVVAPLGRGIDGAGEEGGIGGHAGIWAGGPGDAGVEGAEVGVEGVLADEGFDIVVPAVGGEGADDGAAVGEFGEMGEGGAEGDARDGGGDFPDGAPDFGRRVHFGIEEFGLGRATMHEDEDDGFSGEGPEGIGGEDLGECEAAEAEAPDPEEAAA